MSRWECTSCGYVYDEAVGDSHEGFPPGTSFDEVPDDWPCPDCGVRDKIDFEPAKDGSEPAGDVAERAEDANGVSGGAAELSGDATA